jgi:hypothetical protein
MTAYSSLYCLSFYPLGLNPLRMPDFIKKPADSPASFERSIGDLKTLIKPKERRQKDE